MSNGSKERPGSIFALSSQIVVNLESFPNSAQNDDQIRNLAEGTLRLVNLAVKQDADTIFFLDRSARPAYILLREVWKSLMPEFPLPRVRFINVGLNNVDFVTLPKLAKALADAYKLNNPPSRRIIVADEYSASGKSVQRTKALIEAMYPQAKVLSTGIYRNCPSWYGKMDYLMRLSETPTPFSKNPDKSIFLSRRTEYFPYRNDTVRLFREELQPGKDNRTTRINTPKRVFSS